MLNKLGQIIISLVKVVKKAKLFLAPRPMSASLINLHWTSCGQNGHVLT